MAKPVLNSYLIILSFQLCEFNSKMKGNQTKVSRNTIRDEEEFQNVFSKFPLHEKRTLDRLDENISQIVTFAANHEERLIYFLST